MTAFEILQARGFVQDHTPGVDDFLAAGPIIYYAGFDPTATSLHVGSLVPIMAMAFLQRAGHTPVVVVGGGTGMVGDPSGKDEMRQMLTADAIAENNKAISDQIGLILDLSPGRGHLADNAEWLMELNYIGFLRALGQHFSMNQMLNRTSVKVRLEKGLSFLEFNYQVFQAYDYLELFRRQGCRLQLGGADQWGNILAGVDLIRRVEGEEVHAITFPLVTTSSGAKMGKSVAGAVWLDAERVSPYDYFQYWVNVDDADVGRFLRLFTFLPLDRIAELEALEGADIREAKQVLAVEATTIVHGPMAAQQALEGARAAFAGGSAVGAMPTLETDLPKGVLELLQESGLCSSRSDARRQIRGGGVRLAGEKVSDEELVVGPGHLDEAGAVVLARGKKNKVRLVSL